MKFNIIRESDSGKVSVELFEMQKKKSLNQELIENNFAQLQDVEDEKFSDEDEAGISNLVPRASSFFHFTTRKPWGRVHIAYL